MSGLFRGILTALAIRFTPVGGIAASNVQDAIAELDSEAVKLTGDQSIAGTKTFTATRTIFPVSDSNGLILGNGSTTGIRFGVDNSRQATVHLYDPGSSAFRVLGSSVNTLFFVGNNNRTLIGTSTDNGIDRLQVAGSGLFTGVLKIDSTEAATNTTTGCARFAGGIGVAGNTFIGGEVVITSTTSTTNNLNGALRVIGGISTLNNIGCSNVFTAGISFQSGGTRFITAAVAGSSMALAVRNSADTSTDRALTVYEDGAIYIGKTPVNPGTNNLRVQGSVESSQYRLSALNTAPASATDTGTVGEIRIDTNHIYICTATNTWKRSPLTTW